MTAPDANERLTLSLLDDYRKLIAALKIQRWDAAKWTVTVNVGLTAASAALHDAKWIAALMAMLVAGLGTALVWHYNERATRVRRTMAIAVDYLCQNVFDYRSVVNDNLRDEKSRDYDREELLVFYTAIGISALPTIGMLLAR